MYQIRPSNRAPKESVRDAVLEWFVDTINKTKNFSLECSQMEAIYGDARQQWLFYTNAISYRGSLIQTKDPAYYMQLLFGLSLPKTRLLGISAFFRLFSAKMGFDPDIKQVLLYYFGAIVFIQEFPSAQKRSSSYKLQCDLLGLFLQGKLSAAKLMKIAHDLRKNDFEVDRSQVAAIEQCIGQKVVANPAGGPGVALLVEPLLTVVINLRNLTDQLVVHNRCNGRLTEQFYKAFVDSIRICHLPSLEQRAALDGYLEQSTASCMSKPPFLLMCAAAQVPPDVLEAEVELIELLFFCMRLANDIFSTEREKQEGESEFRRNIVSLLSREGLSEPVARSVAVETYNLALNHYQKRKKSPINERNRDMLAFLEFMNNAPLFVWNRLSGVNNLHS